MKVFPNHNRDSRPSIVTKPGVVVVVDASVGAQDGRISLSMDNNNDLEKGFPFLNDDVGLSLLPSGFSFRTQNE